MGKPFIAYLNEYRLIRAAHLLCASDDDILAISLECGFENVSYFNRLFLREYHMTPSNSGRRAETDAAFISYARF